MSDATVSIEGVRVPRFLYGTAWKEDETQRLTELALQQGFRAIDTANQRRHYHEAAVGRAVAASVASGLLARDDLFLQTKFTFRDGQDHRLPYDPKAPVAALQARHRLTREKGDRTVEVLGEQVLRAHCGQGRQLAHALLQQAVRAEKSHKSRDAPPFWITAALNRRRSLRSS